MLLDLKHLQWLVAFGWPDDFHAFRVFTSWGVPGWDIALSCTTSSKKVGFLAYPHQLADVQVPTCTAPAACIAELDGLTAFYLDILHWEFGVHISVVRSGHDADGTEIKIGVEEHLVNGREISSSPFTTLL